MPGDTHYLAIGEAIKESVRTRGPVTPVSLTPSA